MKTKLVLLGLGSRTTSFYLTALNSLYNQEKGGYSTCPLVLVNTDFNTINSLLPNISEQLDFAVSQYTDEIETLNFQHLLIPNITLHATIDRLKIKTKVLHPVYLSIKAIKDRHWGKVVLFGSLFSMTSSYIKEQFIANGIEVILPSQDDMTFIDVVRQRIYNETDTEELIESYHSIINKYTENTPVVLSCTELSILKPKGNKNLLDMAQVQLEEAIKDISL